VKLNFSVLLLEHVVVHFRTDE